MTMSPGERVEEALFLIGRRGGKYRAAAVLSAYLAALTDGLACWRGASAAWCSRSAPTFIRRRCSGTTSRGRSTARRCYPADRQSSVDALELSQRHHHPGAGSIVSPDPCCDGVAIIASEATFWQTDQFSSNADAAILGAARPALSTTGGPPIIISTPYARKGEVWNLYHRHYGARGDPRLLVAQGTSRDFNPTLSQRVVDRALERDRPSAEAEYLAQFRRDIEPCLRRGREACVVRDRHQLQPGRRFLLRVRRPVWR